MNERRPRLALFIDADNVNLQIAPGIVNCLSANWDVSYRRAYGLNLLNEQDTLREQSIVPVEVLQNSRGKNATDFALVIDAMEELCQGHCEAICIVSADGDYTRLVQRIREKGKTVIVFGKSTSAATLRGACSEFHAIEGLQAMRDIQKKKPVPNKPAPPAPKKPVPSAPKKQAPAVPKKPAPATQTAPPAETEATVRTGLRLAFQPFIETCKDDALGHFGHFLKQNYPNLAPPKFGLRKLKPYLERIGGFELIQIPQSAGKPPNYHVRLPGSKASRTSSENSTHLVKTPRS